MWHLAIIIEFTRNTNFLKLVCSSQAHFWIKCDSIISISTENKNSIQILSLLIISDSIKWLFILGKTNIFPCYWYCRIQNKYLISSNECSALILSINPKPQNNKLSFMKYKWPNSFLKTESVKKKMNTFILKIKTEINKIHYKIKQLEKWIFILFVHVNNSIRNLNHADFKCSVSNHYTKRKHNIVMLYY